MADTKYCSCLCVPPENGLKFVVSEEMARRSEKPYKTFPPFLDSAQSIHISDSHSANIPASAIQMSDYIISGDDIIKLLGRCSKLEDLLCEWSTLSDEEPCFPREIAHGLSHLKHCLKRLNIHCEVGKSKEHQAWSLAEFKALECLTLSDLAILPDEDTWKIGKPRSWLLGGLPITLKHLHLEMTRAEVIYPLNVLHQLSDLVDKSEELVPHLEVLELRLENYDLIDCLANYVASFDLFMVAQRNLEEKCKRKGIAYTIIDPRNELDQ
ncbi:hypothetical protein DSL72_001654 [Monilinia vaccinii-corymbosi]|uniref:Uncharacterized protein n=1 Tax=Monilinia vaccinii-corymbosi TaxID=61207 RepID=A0A8A3P2H6_9HELO|nr:hypothetical protein DSL72_001654 [Monilinia vaccinii-corymbosi]